MNRIIFQIPSAKPRNPVARAARGRHAGAHRTSHASQRQSARRQLRAELSALHPPPKT